MGTRNRPLTVRLEAKEFEALSREARAMHLTDSAYVRLLIERGRDRMFLQHVANELKDLRSAEGLVCPGLNNSLAAPANRLRQPLPVPATLASTGSPCQSFAVAPAVGVKTIPSSGTDVAGVVGPPPDAMATTWTYNTSNNTLVAGAATTCGASGKGAKRAEASEAIPAAPAHGYSRRTQHSKSARLVGIVLPAPCIACPIAGPRMGHLPAPRPLTPWKLVRGPLWGRIRCS